MRTVLIDADGLVYRLAFRNESSVDWDGDGDVKTWSNPELASAQLTDFVDEVIEETGAHKVFMCLSDPDRNWRKDLMPDYKANRDVGERPELWFWMRREVEKHYATIQRQGLEADDVLGILATRPHYGEMVIATVDKDLKSVPGLFYDLNRPEDGIQEISPVEAEKWHLKQTLAGDPVDNYSGARGIGWGKADALVEALYQGDGWAMRPYTHEFTRGPRKGESEVRWEKVPCESVWWSVVTHYHKAGQTPDDALLNARVARILRHGEYSYRTHTPILWTPKRIEHVR